MQIEKKTASSRIYARTRNEYVKNGRICDFEKVASAKKVEYATKIRPHMRLKTFKFARTVAYTTINGRICINRPIFAYAAIIQSQMQIEYEDFFEYVSSFWPHYVEYSHIQRNRQCKLYAAEKLTYFPHMQTFFGRIYAPNMRPPKFRIMRIFGICVMTRHFIR